MAPIDFVICISLVRDETSLAELNPPIWRRFKVSSDVNLELLHDKILAPIMGCGQGIITRTTSERSVHHLG